MNLFSKLFPLGTLLLRDPAHPTRLLPRFASPDHLHPNDTGYQTMADSINLALFK